MPQEPGIYLFLDKDGNVLYVGKAKNLKKRVSSYFTNKNNLLEKTRLLVASASSIKTIVVRSDIDALLLEANYIKKYTPKFNVRLTDGKSYPLIKITIKDEFPKVLIERRQNDKKSIYFGPYPSARSLRLVIKLLRRIFPFQSVLNHPKKNCFYYHLGLCPCPEVNPTIQSRKEYKKNIKHIISFLNGNRKGIFREMEKERNRFAKTEDFESASLIQKKLDAINYITEQNINPFEYEENPNLIMDLRNQELRDLAKILRSNNVPVLNLKRIECFDISNISGTNAVGSMVVFVLGEKETSQYRKFRIKSLPPVPNDFAMMESVIERRLAHKDWEYPDLMVIDGGKGQVSSALKARNKFSLNIPIIGLAKREEIIITSEFKEIRLPRNSLSLHILQNLRDEAHRFAITYHRKLRSKSMF